MSRSRLDRKRLGLSRKEKNGDGDNSSRMSHATRSCDELYTLLEELYILVKSQCRKLVVCFCHRGACHRSLYPEVRARMPGV